MTTFAKSEAWEYHLDITKLDRPHGHHCLTITSRSPTAKNPDARVTQFQVTLDRTDLRTLHNAIGAHLGEQS